MIRPNSSLALLVAVGLAIPGIASALSLSLVNVSGPGAGGTLLPGETVTFDLVLENDAREDVLGIGVFVDGYDTPDIFGTRDFGLELQSGAAASSVLDRVIGPPVNFTETTLENIHSAPFESFQVNNLDPVAWRTIVFQAASLGTTNEDGQLDTGVDGNPILGGAGDVHFRLTYVAAPISPAVQRFDMNFGLNAIGIGGAVLATTGDSFALTVIPEPGTALLMALGLGVLAARRD